MNIIYCLEQIMLIVFEVSKVILDDLGKTFESIIELFDNFDYSVYNLENKLITHKADLIQQM